MTTEDDRETTHELAGGWISERKGTPVPGFLKLAYAGLSAFGVAYLLLFVAGEVGHATRGPLVQQMSATMEPPGPVWIGVLAAILVAFGAALVWYAVVRRAGDGE